MSGFFDVYVTEEGEGADDALALRSILSWDAGDDEDDEDEDDTGISAPFPLGAIGGAVSGNGSASSLARGRSSLTGDGGGFGLSSEAASVAMAGSGSGSGSGGCGSDGSLAGMGPASAALQQLAGTMQSLQSMQSSKQQQFPNHRAAGVGGAVDGTSTSTSTSTSTACGTSGAPLAGGGEDEDDSMNSFLAQLQSEYNGALAPGAGMGIGPGLDSSVGSHSNSHSNNNSIGGDFGFGGDSSNSMNNLLLAGLQYPIPVHVPTLPQMSLLPSVEQTQAHIAQPQPQPHPQQQNQEVQVQVQVQQVQVRQHKEKPTEGARKSTKAAATTKRKTTVGNTNSGVARKATAVAVAGKAEPRPSHQQHPPMHAQPPQPIAPAPPGSSPIIMQSASSATPTPMVPLSLPPVTLPQFAASFGAAQPQMLAAAQFGNFGDSNALLLRQLQILQQQQQARGQQQQQEQQPQPQPPRVLPAMEPPPAGDRNSNPVKVTITEQAPEGQANAAAAIAAPNVVSCSDTDGLTTDAESGRTTRADGTKPSGQQVALAPSPAGRGRGRGKVRKVSTGAGSKKPISTLASACASGNVSSILPRQEHDSDQLATDEESRAKAARERNREHARNTRLRKAAYLDKLKVTVEELCRERDILVSERAGAANLLVEMHKTRTDVLLSFFALRSSNERRRELWSSILDESCFSCLLPVTPYRSFPASEVQVARCQRTVLGIDGMMADTASLHVLLNSLLDRSRFPDAKIEFRYTLVTEDAVVAGNQMMARWIMTTQNAVECGANMEVSKRGMLCCKFNSAHKITGLELMFDVMAFMLQLKQAAGTDSFSVVPNTVQTCQRPFDVPMVMAMAERPYTIVQINRLWEDMTGWKAEDVVGRASCRVLQGQATEKVNLEGLMSDLCHKRPTNVVLTNYTKSGRQFHNHLNFYPLSTDSKITHYVALTTYAGWTDGAGPGDPMGSKATTPANSQEQCSMPKGIAGRKARAKPAKATVVDADSVKTHQAVSSAQHALASSRAPQQASHPAGNDRQPKQVVVAGPTNRQDSSTSNCGGDTLSRLTSSLSSSNSDDGGNSNCNSSTSDPLSQQEQAVESSLLDTTPASSLRKTVTSQSSSSSSAGGSTSTNGSSFDEPKSKLRSKREGRKRKNEAATDEVLVEDEKKRKVARRQTPGTVLS